VIDGELSEGHARALLGAADAATIERLAAQVLRQGLSVRQTEALVRARAPNKAAPGRDSQSDGKSASVRDLELRLTRALGVKVEVRHRGGPGELAVHYGDLNALDRIVDKLLQAR
jgi:ParB family chromosome partitioning protein